MKSQPLVSVIMNCLNSERYLQAAIDSVYAQTYSNWEIIFWDNASNDGSANIAKKCTDGRLRYFKGEATVPLGQARNMAIEKSRAELIAFLDCDDLWLPEKLEKQVPLFLADEQVGLVYSDTYFFNEEGTHKRLYAKKKPYRGFQFQNLLTNYLVSLETAVVRKAALESLDRWFDERFNMIEEYDLFVRIGVDWKVDFVPEVLAKWRVHGESWSWKDPDSFVDENTVMLNDLMGDEKICRTYADALSIAKNKLILKQSLKQWRNGNARGARKIIRQIPEHSSEFWLVLLGSYFPYKMFESVYRCLSGTVTPTR